MNKRITQKIGYLFLLTFLASAVFAQDLKSVTGTEKFGTSSKSCFSRLDWSMNYKYDCSDMETSSFIIVFSDAKFSIAGSKFMYNGKEYSPSDANLSDWPEDYSKYGNVKFHLAVMHGSTVLHEEDLAVLNGSGKRVRVGIYRDGFFNTTGYNAQKFTGINYKNCTIKITNITNDGCNMGGQPLIDAIKAKKGVKTL